MENKDNAQLNPAFLPVHVGIIMDGNGRWALKRNLARTMGHNEGVKAAKRIVKCASDLGIKYLSLYTFSTENWNRAKEEVTFLMQLIKIHLRKEFNFYKKNNIKVLYSGDPLNIPPNILNELENVEKDTVSFNGMTLNLAINHGGRDEIIRAFNSWLRQMAEQQRELAQINISEQEIQNHFDRPGVPDIDFVIRTGGEYRISNFFIWKCAYAELYFCNKLWPDWDREDFLRALINYQERDRRFGGVK